MEHELSGWSSPFFGIVCDKVAKTGGKEKLMCRLHVTPVARQLALKNLFTRFVPVFCFARFGLGLRYIFTQRFMPSARCSVLVNFKRSTYFMVETLRFCLRNFRLKRPNLRTLPNYICKPTQKKKGCVTRTHKKNQQPSPQVLVGGHISQQLR